MLDLRHIHLGAHNIAAFPHKRQATAFAKERGYYPSRDALQAYNRFCQFWIVGQYSTDGWHIATKDSTPAIITMRELP